MESKRLGIDLLLENMDLTAVPHDAANILSEPVIWNNDLWQQAEQRIRQQKLKLKARYDHGELDDQAYEGELTSLNESKAKIYNELQRAAE